MAYYEFGNWHDAGRPRWLADERHRDHLIPGPVKLDAAQFPFEGTVVVQMAAAAAAGATTLTVDPLTGPIPSGTILDFTGAGEFAKLAAAAAQGATSLTVEALDAAIEDNDTATYVGTGKKRVVAGTVVGRTIAERDAQAGYGPAAAADDEIYILALDAPDLTIANDGVLLRPNSVVKENYLPEVEAGTLAAGVLAEVRARYVAQRGA